MEAQGYQQKRDMRKLKKYFTRAHLVHKKMCAIRYQVRIYLLSVRQCDFIFKTLPFTTAVDIHLQIP